MNKIDTFYFWYFVVHIPITILIDLCLVVPPASRHWVQQLAVKFHIDSNKDFLLQAPPLWLQYFGAFEMFFQLPLFFIAAYGLYKRLRKVLVVLIVYGFNAAFTTGACLTYVVSRAEEHGLSAAEKWKLFGLYVPYLLIPAFMMVECSARVMSMIDAKRKMA